MRQLEIMPRQHYLTKSITAIVTLSSISFALSTCSARQPRLCVSSETCGSNSVCMIGRCAGVSASSPVPPMTRRVVLEPIELSFVTSNTNGEALEEASYVWFASDRFSARMLVKFPQVGWPSDTIERAYLVIHRANHVALAKGQSKFSTLRIVEPWSSKESVFTRWSTPPRALPLDGAQALFASAGAQSEIRMDVTSFVIERTKKKTNAFSFRVEAEGEGAGVPVSTGNGNGQAPYLDLYLQ